MTRPQDLAAASPVSRGEQPPVAETRGRGGGRRRPPPCPGAGRPHLLPPRCDCGVLLAGGEQFCSVACEEVAVREDELMVEDER